MVDQSEATRHNQKVRRSLLLAIGVFTLLWTLGARTPANPSPGLLIGAAGESCALTADSDGPSQSELKWRAQLHTIGIVTESIWTSSLVHVELGGTPSPRTVDISLASSSPDPPAASAPHYLRHTPLLI